MLQQLHRKKQKIKQGEKCRSLPEKKSYFLQFQCRDSTNFKRNLNSNVQGKERNLWDTSSKVRVNFDLNGTTFNIINSNQKQNINPEEWEPLQNSYLVNAKANIWKVNAWFKIFFWKKT